MGLRYFEICCKLQDLRHEGEILSNINRLVVDFGLYLPFENQPPESRMVDVNLGAGCLLDRYWYLSAYMGTHDNTIRS
jgi:hypothetical protein